MTEPAIDSSAPISRRAIAYVIDALISGAIATVGIVILVIVAFTTRPIENLLIVMPIAYGVLLLVLLGWLVVYTIMQTGKGSIGMRAQALRLASAVDGAPIGFGRALLRNVVFGLSASIVVGYFTPLFDGSGRFQGWHDKAAKARMLDAKLSPAPARAARPAPQTADAQAAVSTPAVPGIPGVPAPAGSGSFGGPSLATPAQGGYSAPGLPPVPVMPPAPLGGGYGAPVVSPPPGYAQPAAPAPATGSPFAAPQPQHPAQPQPQQSPFAAPPSPPAAQSSPFAAPPQPTAPQQPYAAPAQPQAAPAQPYAAPAQPQAAPAQPAAPQQPAVQHPDAPAPVVAGDDASVIAFVPGVTQPGAPARPVIPTPPPAGPAIVVDTLDETIVQRPGATESAQSIAEREAEVERTRISVPGHRLVFTWDDGTRISVSRRTVFGRNPAPEEGAVLVPVRDETLSLSKTHFEAAAEVAGGWVLDRHSTNGMTIVRDGQRIACPPGQRVPVRLGDAIEIGDRIVTVGGYA